MGEQDIYDRIELVRDELRDLALHDESLHEPVKHDPRRGPIHGTVEEIAYYLPFDAIYLKIDGGWLGVRHKQLRQAIDALRPQVGEDISVLCIGKTGSEYDYSVGVDHCERMWPDDEEEDGRPAWSRSSSPASR